MALAAISWWVGLARMIPTCIVVIGLKSTMVVAGCWSGFSLMGSDGFLRIDKGE